MRRAGTASVGTHRSTGLLRRRLLDFFRRADFSAVGCCGIFDEFNNSETGNVGISSSELCDALIGCLAISIAGSTDLAIDTLNSCENVVDKWQGPWQGEFVAIIESELITFSVRFSVGKGAELVPVAIILRVDNKNSPGCAAHPYATL